MGNTESGYDDDSHEYFRHQRPSYGGSSMDHNYQPWSYTESSMDHSHQPTSYAGSSAHHSHQPMSYAGSSAHHNYQRPQQATRFADNYNTLDEVISALREAGLESSNLILGIDFTKSNEWTGKYSFNRKSLHAISNIRNPYEQAISIIGRTLSPFDEDNLIPCFGFGDGPTSFAPIIDAAIDIVEASNRQYHVLVIIADGQVTRNPDTPAGRLSPQEQATVNSIVAASHYPLSIILVGVGDGPWDSVQQFDDNIPQRAFDNFQFVNFTKIMSENKETSKKEAAFALAALMEIPLQYKATLSLHSFNGELVAGPRTRLLPPPREVIDHDNVVKSIPHMTNFETVEATAPVEPVCPICLTNPKDMAFGCGHTTCKDCGTTISSCPMCREPITTRLRLYT
ncbi:E3 ubiquitin-protein ligase RGLG3 isoform X2 [Citrus clementina]|uniref:E3 ubiquitin-protein ligase RGLG3 isoform X2 n=1 Tax=Citrus clementina TaxID=85681 RepID=UPI000CED146B|nr:E3 ubiquitin-protein ligase RGLG3 isoform X2 [Citrus x clementina]